MMRSELPGPYFKQYQTSKSKKSKTGKCIIKARCMTPDTLRTGCSGFFCLFQPSQKPQQPSGRQTNRLEGSRADSEHVINFVAHSIAVWAYKEEIPRYYNCGAVAPRHNMVDISRPPPSMVPAFYIKWVICPLRHPWLHTCLKY